ncbi:TM2 domain-containing protein [Enterococcus wangshanyuanii]|uniref:TM2 domain-containing protein n=1 Tax=Enterococcus wangshanyuanii TaxID=2005703 RepID=UPI000B4B53B2|nr:TM2 domain-containing protein [Enterococcus wangshanyuanii]
MGGYVQQGRVVNKWIYFILAFFLGWIDAHKFYSGFSGKGIMYLVFSWTGIPALIAFFTAIMTLLKPADQNGNIVVTS